MPKARGVKRVWQGKPASHSETAWRRQRPCQGFRRDAEADPVDEARRPPALGRGVSRLTTTVTANPPATPNTPAEIGRMPNHRRPAPVMPKDARIQGSLRTM